jgi:ribosome-associated protein
MRGVSRCCKLPSPRYIDYTTTTVYLMSTAQSKDTAAKKDIQKLQRAIVDGLEDVKAQDIQVFNTEHLSPLFERVIVASGTSNRQTKALAASVRDAVREAGFAKPRTEGEDNGEWIIVDCGQAVAHIMQPAIRQYYHLEEIWGDMPVRLKLGAPKPATAKEAAQPAAKTPARKAAAKTVAKDEPARPRAAKPKAAPAAAGKTAARKSAVKTAPKPAAKAPVKKVVVKAPKSATAKTTTVRKAPAKKAATKTIARKKA